MPVPSSLRPNLARLFALLALLISIVGPRTAAAQCEPQWQPFDPTTASLPGVNGLVSATTIWDPDGPGPQTPKLIVGGSFSLAGNTLADNIALYDPATGAWSALGTGMSGGNLPGVYALTTLPNGDLIAGGLFFTAGGVTANNIARWNGSAWSALGTGMSGGNFPGVRALTTLPSGDLIAGGDFTTAGGVTVNNIARWNGSAWSALGTGTNDTVFALTTLPSGELIAGGNFTTAGGVTVNGIARWNGSAWSALGTGMDFQVRALTTLPNGDLIAGGYFTTAGGVTVNNIACWNGSAWSAMGSGMGISFPFVYALTTLPSGDLIAGGDFTTAGGVVAPYIARWACPPAPPPTCNYDFNQDENVDLTDAQLMAQVAAGVITADPSWLSGDLNGDENADLTDAQLLAAYVVTGTCGV